MHNFVSIPNSSESNQLLPVLLLATWPPAYAPPPCAPERVCFVFPPIPTPSRLTLSTCLIAVTEGYLNSPPSSPLKQAPVSLTGAAGYQLSARESNRQVFSSSSGTYSPLPSPSKRKRSHPDSHDDDEHSIAPFFVTPESRDRGALAAELSGNDMVVDRPMKPLRRSGRIREMSSLPPTCSLFRCETEMNSHQCEEDSTNMRSTQLSPKSASDNEQHY